MNVEKTCTFEQLKNETYKTLNVDRNKYVMHMKFQYVQCLQPCDPQEIQRDKDVRNFLKQVREKVPTTPLYVEVLPRVSSFNTADHENMATSTSGNKSRQFGTLTDDN